jgi:hypothetical protein
VGDNCCRYSLRDRLHEQMWHILFLSSIGPELSSTPSQKCIAETYVISIKVLFEDFLQIFLC